MWWMDRSGALHDSAEAVADLARARSQPSLQLVGDPSRRSLDLGTLRDMGVRVVGRTCDIDGATVRLRDDLAETTTAAHETLLRLLKRFDSSADASGLPREFPPRPLILGPSPDTLDLRAEGIRTVVWAIGYRRDYSWLRVPVLDETGEIRHQGGVTPSPGLYVLGLRFLRRRNSNFIDGVGRDAQELADHLCRHLECDALAA